ncbi:MAG: hypothetical protein IIY21_05985 [Clostridiales bacterium]|nr:hypothetical protein [Clostridiales bacterium]
MAEYELRWFRGNETGVMIVTDVAFYGPNGPWCMQKKGEKIGADRIMLYSNGELLRDWSWVNGKWKAHPVKKKKKDTEMHPFGL